MWRDFNLQMRRQVKSEYLFMFKFYFVEKRMYIMHIMKNKFNQINEEIILNDVVKNTSLRK